MQHPGGGGGWRRGGGRGRGSEGGCGEGGCGRGRGREEVGGGGRGGRRRGWPSSQFPEQLRGLARRLLEHRVLRAPLQLLRGATDLVGAASDHAEGEQGAETHSGELGGEEHLWRGEDWR